MGAQIAETDWLKKHFPKYKQVGQALTSKGKKTYDAIDLEGPNGEKKTIYFDITASFGLPKDT